MTQINLANVPKKTALNNTDRMTVWPEVVTADSDLEHTTIADLVTKVNTDISGNYVPLTPIDAKGDLLIGTANNTVNTLSVGTNNHVLTADSAQVTGVKWAPVISPTIVDAKGDLIVGTASDTVARLAAGTNGHILYANSAATNGVEWAAPPAGKVVNHAYVSNTTGTITSSNSTPSFTVASLSYTPLSASNILIIEATGNGYADTDGVTASTVRRVEFHIVNSTSSTTLAYAVMSFGFPTSNAVSGTLLTVSPIVRVIVSAASTVARTYQFNVQATSHQNYGVLGFSPNILSVTEIAP